MLKLIKQAVKKALISLGADFRLRSHDRRVLEETIFPYVGQQPDFQRILFVGCEWYTRGYAKPFAAKEYWTLEIDPGKSRYGSKRHVVDSCENTSQHFKAGTLDVIFLNGVFGWGLTTKEAIEKTFAGLYECLRPGGLLVFGWNDVPEHRPMPIEQIDSLKKFTPVVFPPLATSCYLTTNTNRHTFNFYAKEPAVS